MLTGWAPKLPALGALPTSWWGNTTLQRLSDSHLHHAVRSKAVPSTPSPAPPEMSAQMTPRAQPRKIRADCLSSGARGARGTSPGLPAAPRGNQGPRTSATVMSRTLRGASPPSLLLQGHTRPLLLGALPGHRGGSRRLGEPWGPALWF